MIKIMIFTQAGDTKEHMTDGPVPSVGDQLLVEGQLVEITAIYEPDQYTGLVTVVGKLVESRN